MMIMRMNTNKKMLLARPSTWFAIKTAARQVNGIDMWELEDKGLAPIVVLSVKQK